MRRFLLALLLLLGLSLVLAAGYEAAVAAMERRAYPPPGRLVDVGGHRLHLECAGDGSPAVILEGGAGEATPMWGWILPEVAKATRVCAYDRAGLGWSDAGPGPRDGERTVAELHALLRNAGIEPPYVLVGHSFGGELVRLFRDKYAGEVAGMVLVDSSHPDQLARIPELQAATAEGDQLNLAAVYIAPLGLMRLYWGEAGPNPDLPPRRRAEMRAFYATAAPYRAQLAEGQARPATDAQVRAAGPLGDLPLIVVTTDGGGPWRVLQDELAALSTNSRLRVVEGGTHLGLLTAAEQAEQTAAAIVDVVAAGRSGQPLGN